jgi:hypothetical protein
MDGEDFSEEHRENMRIENEILRIKLKAQYGDAFYMESNEGLPPEIENQFLKSMMAFEDEYAREEYTTIYDRIGRPEFAPTNEIAEEELQPQIERLMQLLDKNDISLRICDGPYPAQVIHRFITEELFQHKIEKNPIAGMTSNFIYEEFYPNHKADIIKRTHTFLRHWFERKFNEYCTELSWHCVSSDGTKYTREDIITKTKMFFEAFHEFNDDGYNIDNISFELQEDDERGLGFSEGTLKYKAFLENGEFIQYQGPYKLYMHLEDGWWSIFNFIMPGFKL